MPRYRKKPMIVEAIQFDTWGPHKMKLPDGVIITHRVGGEDNLNYTSIKFGINNFLRGRIKVHNGDWIIKDTFGEFYPCKNDIFLAIYEKVDYE